MLTWVEENWPYHPAAFVIALTFLVLGLALFVFGSIGIAIGLGYLADHVPATVAVVAATSFWVAVLRWALACAWRSSRTSEPAPPQPAQEVTDG